MKKKNKPLPMVNLEEVQPLQENYIDKIENDIEYALIVDPKNEYDFSDKDKEFITQFIQFKNITLAANMAGMEIEDAKKLYLSIPAQNEIRRINKALYQRQFATKLISLDKIGGYLTSLLTDDYVPIANQLNSKDKLSVIDLIIKLNQLKAAGMLNPTVIMEKDINTQLKELSVDSIKMLLNSKSNKDEKNSLISQIDKDNCLSLEEKSYLESLTTEELLKILNETNNGDKNE